MLSHGTLELANTLAKALKYNNLSVSELRASSPLTLEQLRDRISQLAHLRELYCQDLAANLAVQPHVIGNHFNALLLPEEDQDPYNFQRTSAVKHMFLLHHHRLPVAAIIISYCDADGEIAIEWLGAIHINNKMDLKELLFAYTLSFIEEQYNTHSLHFGRPLVNFFEFLGFNYKEFKHRITEDFVIELIPENANKLNLILFKFLFARINFLDYQQVRTINNKYNFISSTLFTENMITPHILRKMNLVIKTPDSEDFVNPKSFYKDLSDLMIEVEESSEITEMKLSMLGLEVMDSKLWKFYTLILRHNEIQQPLAVIIYGNKDAKAKIHSLQTSLSYQRLGLATVLLHYVMELLMLNGIKAIKLCSLTEGLRTYLPMGFKPKPSVKNLPPIDTTPLLFDATDEQAKQTLYSRIISVSNTFFNNRYDQGIKTIHKNINNNNLLTNTHANLFRQDAIRYTEIYTAPTNPIVPPYLSTPGQK